MIQVEEARPREGFIKATHLLNERSGTSKRRKKVVNLYTHPSVHHLFSSQRQILQTQLLSILQECFLPLELELEKKVLRFSQVEFCCWYCFVLSMFTKTKERPLLDSLHKQQNDFLYHSKSTPGNRNVIKEQNHKGLIHR